MHTHMHIALSHKGSYFILTSPIYFLKICSLSIILINEKTVKYKNKLCGCSMKICI